MHRQGVEELVGDQQQRSGRHLAEPGRPKWVESGEASGLCRPQPLTGLDQVKAQSVVKTRDGTRGAQGIGEKGAAPGPELDQTERRRPPEVEPCLGQPCPHHLAECLAELRRRHEIAVRSERVALAVIA